MSMIRLDMAISWDWFCFDFALVQHVLPLCLHCPLAQLFSAPWACGIYQRSVSLSFDSLKSTYKTYVLTDVEAK